MHNLVAMMKPRGSLTCAAQLQQWSDMHGLVTKKCSPMHRFVTWIKPHALLGCKNKTKSFMHGLVTKIVTCTVWLKHTHTHTHTHTHARTHTHTHTHTHAWTGYKIKSTCTAAHNIKTRAAYLIWTKPHEQPGHMNKATHTHTHTNQAIETCASWLW